MKKLFLFAFVFAMLQSNVSAQTAPAIEWQKTFGGSASDEARSVRQTSDGGYIVAGYTRSNNGDVSGNHGGDDFWVVKFNSNGTIDWKKNLGGSLDDDAKDIRQTSDGGYIVVGRSRSSDGDLNLHYGATSTDDCWIVKLTSTGSIVWQRTLGGSGFDVAHSVQQTSDGNYIIAGYTSSNDFDVNGINLGSDDYWVVKLSANGNDILWSRTLGGSSKDRANSIQQTNDGGYIIAGESWSTNGHVTGHNGLNNPDYWVVKLDSDGALQWQKSLGGSEYDVANSIQQTNDGGYIVAGYSNSNDGDVSGHQGLTFVADYWVVKLNSSGNIQWQKSLGGWANDFAYSIKQTSDGGFIVAGSSESTDGDVSGNHGGGAPDFWVVKLNSSGNIQWQKSLGGNDGDEASSIQQTSDGGYIIAGFTYSVDGDVSGNHGGFDAWLVKLAPDGILATQNINKKEIALYPNPVKDVLYFSEEVTNMKITDVSGRLVKQILTYSKLADVSQLAKGVYMISAVTKEGKTITRKMVKE